MAVEGDFRCVGEVGLGRAVRAGWVGGGWLAPAESSAASGEPIFERSRPAHRSDEPHHSDDRDRQQHEGEHVHLQSRTLPRRPDDGGQMATWLCTMTSLARAVCCTSPLGCASKMGLLR